MGATHLNLHLLHLCQRHPVFGWLSSLPQLLFQMICALLQVIHSLSALSPHLLHLLNV